METVRLYCSHRDLPNSTLKSQLLPSVTSVGIICFIEYFHHKLLLGVSHAHSLTDTLRWHSNMRDHPLKRAKFLRGHVCLLQLQKLIPKELSFSKHSAATQKAGPSIMK